MPVDGGHLLFLEEARHRMISDFPDSEKYIKPFIGSRVMLNGISRYCLWIEDADRAEAESIYPIKERLDGVSAVRKASTSKATLSTVSSPHRFTGVRNGYDVNTVVIPRISSENRLYLQPDFIEKECVVGDTCFAIYGNHPWCVALLASRSHLVWVDAVCRKMKTDFNYSNSMGWNTFPVPLLTEADRETLLKSTQHILTTRANHPNKTLAQLYSLTGMPSDLKEAHASNDGLVDKIVLGKECKDDKERLSLLLAKYQDMTSPKRDDIPTLKPLF